MVSLCQQRLKTAISVIDPDMKALGFRKTGSTYNRLSKTDNITQVVNFQLSTLNFKHQCRCAVNLGVNVHVLHPKSYKYVKESFCDFRLRLGLLVFGKDGWYILDETPKSVGEHILTMLKRHGFGWLETYSSYKGIINQWDTLPDEQKMVQFGTAMTMIDLFSHLGQIDRVKTIIEPVYHYNLEIHPRRSEMMVEIAEAHGITLS